MSRLRRRRGHGHGHTFLCALTNSRSGLCGRLGEKLFEIFEEVGGRVEKTCDLRVNVLDRFLFALVCLENFQELLVDFGFVLETILGSWSAGMSSSWAKKNLHQDLTISRLPLEAPDEIMAFLALASNKKKKKKEKNRHTLILLT
jgi:hypothetical protein